jgi:hypothetical protein
MTYAPLTAPWIGLLLLAWALVIALLDVAVIFVRRDRREFPGGSRRLAWAIAIRVIGLTGIYGLVLFLPMSLLYAAGAALGLPEWAGYLISFFGAGAGVCLAMLTERQVTKHLASPLLADREAFLGSLPKREDTRS